MSKVGIAGVMEQLVARKRERLENKGAVYAGRMEAGEWVPESLFDIFRGWGEIVEFPKERDEDWTPEEQLENDYEFLGGTQNRGFYLNMEQLRKHEHLNEWFQDGDAHLLASMFLRPGKTARERTSFSLADKHRVEEGCDGLLMTMSVQEWDAFRSAYALPDCTWAQVTIFRPEGVIAKGGIRQVLPGEEPTIYLESWKWLRGRLRSIPSVNMSVLTVDSVYQPRPSVNKQEVTYAQHQGADLADWVLKDLEAEVHSIVIGERVNPDNLPGYLQALGMPKVDSLVQDIQESVHNTLMRLAKKIPLRRENGWRGKSTASSVVAQGTVLLPEHLKSRTTLGGTVFVSRNPNLPRTGYVRYIVAGYHAGNTVVFNENDDQWGQVLGGDHDGDDAVVLFQCPFTQLPDVYRMADGSVFNLQEMKFNSRKLKASTPTERIERWQRETQAPIGQFDIIARYAVDLGQDTPEVMDDLTRIIQLAISLKKRMGHIEDHITQRVDQLQRLVGKGKRSTETYYFREYPKMNHVERRALRENLKSPSSHRWIEGIETGVEINKRKEPRFTIARVEGKLTGMVDDVTESDLKAAEVFYERYLALHSRLGKTIREEDDTARMKVNRELKMLCQVEMPEHAMSLTDEEWVRFSACVYYCAPSDKQFWLYTTHPGFLLLALKEVYAKEKPMLVGEHELEEGDTVELHPYQRVVNAKGRLMDVSSGIVVINEPITATVTKVHKKSVQLTW